MIALISTNPLMLLWVAMPPPQEFINSGSTKPSWRKVPFTWDVQDDEAAVYMSKKGCMNS